MSPTLTFRFTGTFLRRIRCWSHLCHEYASMTLLRLTANEYSSPLPVRDLTEVDPRHHRWSLPISHHHWFVPRCDCE